MHAYHRISDFFENRALKIILHSGRKHRKRLAHSLEDRVKKRWQGLVLLLEKTCLLKGPRGGMVTQRIANPSTPVRFRARPPYLLKNS